MSALARKVLVASALLAWVAAIGSGARALASYQTTPGRSRVAPSRWPAQVPFLPAPHVPTLVMLGHPRCPCSEASLSALQALLVRHPGRLEAHVLFTAPEVASPEWSAGPRIAQARAIPGVAVHLDVNGVAARALGADTSGDVLLFDPSGALQFHGGLTPGRGLPGESAGSAALDALLEGRPARLTEGPAFGCPLVTAVKEQR